MKLNRQCLVFWSIAGLLALGMNMPARSQNGRAKAAGKDGHQTKPEDQRTTRLTIHVVRGDKREPVDNASVYLKFQEPGALHFLLRRQKKVELDLKTDVHGYASFPEVPRGKLLIQIISPGWQTFGEYYELDKDSQTIEIQLQRPKTKWY